jgi:hypothetical protein
MQAEEKGQGMNREKNRKEGETNVDIQLRTLTDE